MTSRVRKKPARARGGHTTGRERARRSRSGFNEVVQDALGMVRRHPAPALLIAGMAGWLLVFFGKNGFQSGASRRRIRDDAVDLPVLNTGNARVYDPDAPSLHPTQDLLESRREMSARV